MDTSNKYVVPRKKMAKLGRRIADSVTVPADNLVGGRARRTSTRARVWVDAADGEENEDEATRERRRVEEGGEDEEHKRG